ncbi:type I secretion system permease/ATPase [Catenovulum sp. 2E275]|uniref:type I secretion system permease/ATPase n=1 Tax=Catenovulum sp. 2E275 TaxID=2980497 RepID=UPI0021CEBBC7|nr:type I secretion system permease/ATPase [Catenovulum sp. 2E275]MCU4676840.1 type I secretion system permease/ATPase [Catenovulum sp. 2E275]
MSSEPNIFYGGTLFSCLTVIAHHYNLNKPSQSILAGLPLEDGELKPSNFHRAAKRVGLVSKVAQRNLEQVNPHLLPAILLLENNQACILLELNLETQTALLIYPDLSEASAEVPISELKLDYTEQLIYARPEFHYDQRAHDINTESNHPWFWSLVKECRPLYRDVIIAAFIVSLLSIAMPLFVMNIYDRVVPNSATDTLWVLAVGVLIALTADFVIRLIRNHFVEIAACRIDIKASSRIMEQVLGMRLANRPTSAGSFATSVQAFESVRSFCSSMIVVALVDLPFVLLFILIIGLISPLLILPIIAGALLIFAYALSTQKKMHQLSELSMKASAMRNAILVESIHNLDDVKSFNSESKIQQVWENTTIEIASITAKNRALSVSITNLATWLQQAVGICIMVIGVYLVIDGGLSQGGLIAAYLLSSRAMGPLSQSASLMAQYHNASTAMQSLDEVMANPIEKPHYKNYLSHPIIYGDIEFINVCFKYPNQDKYALNNVSFKIKAGEHIAILGKNGSGKSTIEKLIMGLYQVESGQIFIDGVEISQLDPAELRHNIGYVPQDIHLFYGTLKDNINLSTWHTNDELLHAACKLSHLDQLIQNHPDGINLAVGEQGKNLSGGQRQAVAIARAMINDPNFYLLDEPTGALDLQSENKIINSLTNLSIKKTLILITHKSSLLTLVDRIIVLDSGKIVADGAKDKVILSLKTGEVSKAS